MRIIETKQIMIEQEVTLDILCNNCGSSCKSKYYFDNYRPHVGLLEIEVSGSYWSSELSDCTTYQFSLCEKCLTEMFSKFKIPVNTNNYNAGDPIGVSK